MSGVDVSGASISGTVYQSDGITPMTGKILWIYAYTGTPCGSVSRVGYASVDKSTGNYTIAALPSGTYYLRSNSSFFIKENILDEWWAVPKSVRDCAEAQSVAVTDAQPVTGKNFQLEPGATISGATVGKTWSASGPLPCGCDMAAQASGSRSRHPGPGGLRRVTLPRPFNRPVHWMSQ
jgi:hypothetical protein